MGKVTPEDAKKLQAMLDSKNHTGVNLDLDVETRVLTWGCRHCGAAPVRLVDKCAGGGFFPGLSCEMKKDRYA